MFKKIYTTIKDGWMWFAEKVGLVNSTILLTVVFAIVIGLYSILQKIIALFKKKEQKTSNWQPFTHNQFTIEDITREF